MTKEHRHRSIRRKTHAIHLLMLPLAVLAGFAWIYFAYGVCDEGAVGAMSACRYFELLPFLPTAVGLLFVAFIVWDLVEFGRDWHESAHGKRPSRHVKHAARGYKTLDDRHKRHVHHSVLHVLLVTAAVAAWFLYKIHASTH